MHTYTVVSVLVRACLVWFGWLCEKGSKFLDLWEKYMARRELWTPIKDIYIGRAGTLYLVGYRTPLQTI